jgi:hypothetical protein
MFSPRLFLPILLLLCFFANVASSVAAPGEFSASKYPNALHAAPGSNLIFTVEGSAAECNKAELDSANLSGASKELSLTPTYSECNVFGLPGATITPNGCTYGLGQPEGSGDFWSGGLAIKCPAGKKIVIAGTSGFGNCTVEVGEQSGLSKVEYENQTANAHLGLTFAVSKLSATVTVSNGVCPVNLGEKKNATLTGPASGEAKEGGSLLISG